MTEPAYDVRLRRLSEGFSIETRAGKALAYVHFAEGTRQAATNRVSEVEALSIARRIARALSRPSVAEAE